MKVGFVTVRFVGGSMIDAPVAACRENNMLSTYRSNTSRFVDIPLPRPTTGFGMKTSIWQWGLLETIGACAMLIAVLFLADNMISLLTRHGPAKMEEIHSLASMFHHSRIHYFRIIDEDY